MLRLLLVASALAVGVGCTCSNSDLAESAAGPATVDKTAKTKTAKTKRPEPVDRAPVLRNGRFRIPLKSLTEADLGKVREAIKAAQAAVKRPDDEVIEPATKQWKCRQTTAYEVNGAESKPQLFLYERFDKPDCFDESATREKWEANLRYVTGDRPDKRDQGGKFPFTFAGEDYDLKGDTFQRGFAAVYELESGKGVGGFEQGDEFLASQLPEGLELGGKAVTMGDRWSVGVAMVAGEKITVEGERWRCVGDKKAVSAELIFRTNKRAAGHTPNTPKDVVVTEKVRAFAQKIAEELGDLAGGTGNVTAAAASCTAE
jgi:hypothetical protein